MQACFVEIGLERGAFLHAKDLPTSDNDRDRPIQQLVTEGQDLLVQVIKDPIGSKGARLTAEVSTGTSFGAHAVRNACRD